MRESTVVSLAGRPHLGGHYFRVRYNDHQGFARLLAERRLSSNGLIFDARHHLRHSGFLREAREESLSTCLDSQAMELALPGATSKSRSELPWAFSKVHTADDFDSAFIKRFAKKLAEFVVVGGYSSVFAPTHYISSDESIWLSVDAELTYSLANELRKLTTASVEIVYPLALHSGLFSDPTYRNSVLQSLKGLPIDAISLRVHPLSATSGPLAIRRFIEGARDMRSSGLPVMVERGGMTALAAYALGVADRVESGVTFGDSFDVGALLRPVPSIPRRQFAPPMRVYVEALGVCIELDSARALLNSSHGKSWFGCKDRLCCPNGPNQMIEDPFRHSALARLRHFNELSKTPSTIRGTHFVHSIVGRATDMLSRAGEIDASFKKAHQRTLSVKETLHELVRDEERKSDTRPSSDARTAQLFAFPSRDPKLR